MQASNRDEKYSGVPPGQIILANAAPAVVVLLYLQCVVNKVAEQVPQQSEYPPAAYQQPHQIQSAQERRPLVLAVRAAAVVVQFIVV